MLLTHSKVPKVPSNFIITAQHDTAISLSWDLPSGRGPENIVDYYMIHVTPLPVSHPGSLHFVPFPPWNMTVEYYKHYTISISAVNCAGESDRVIIEFGRNQGWMVSS